MEIERKFLYPGDSASLPEAGRTRIRQGYLTLGGSREIRIRDRDGAHFLTVKDGSGISRAEKEMPISQSQFESLWPLTGSRRIEKTRYQLPHGSHLVEIDFYEGPHTGLKIAEVEFSSLSEAAAFSIPSFLGEEVSDNPAYSNARLATDGLPPVRTPKSLANRPNESPPLQFDPHSSEG